MQHPPPPPRGRPGRGWRRAAIVTLVLAVLAPLVVFAVEERRLDRANERIAALEQQVADLREDAAPDDDATPAPEGSDDGQGDDATADGGADPLDDLLGGVDPGVVECLTPDDPSGLLGGGVEGDTPQEQIDAIEDLVAEERRLEPQEPIEPTFLSSAEIAARVEALIAEEYTPELADADGRILAALGAAPPGVDMATLTRELLAGQVVGFYDPDTGELVVEQARGELDGTTKVTLAHELGHALVDQVLGLPEASTAETGIADADASLAAAALVEGDATLLMQRFALANLSIVEQLGMAGEAAGPEAEALARAPSFVRDQLVFPYLAGLEFVCSLYRDGGWDAVDRAYEDPPTTTAEILFPERYRGDQPAVEVAPPSPPGPDWDETRTDTLGAADLLALFRAPGGDRAAALSNPLERAGAWDGGSLTLWTRGDESAVGLRLVDRGGGPPLCESVAEWYRASFPDAEPADAPEARAALDGARQDAVVRCDGDRVTVGIAPDLQAAARITTG